MRFYENYKTGEIIRARSIFHAYRYFNEDGKNYFYYARLRDIKRIRETEKVKKLSKLFENDIQKW